MKLPGAIFIPVLALVPEQEKTGKYAAVSGGGTAMLEKTLKAAIPEVAKRMAEPGISKVHLP